MALERKERINETENLIKMNATDIQNELDGLTYNLDAMEAVLEMMMSVDTDQKAVAFMMISCVSAMKKCVEKAWRLTAEIRTI
jgi:hypothetical protein